ncbi:Uncharacterized protein ycf39 [Vitis vinifera]|uniref:Uncharacterized protein ycf39 n=1 Tax=Vitis vinifera TaxID=29760 RepID=A0A438IIT7_VITVI|nr:Uncharacterized protein ycf39 [Vitis vinifera]
MASKLPTQLATARSLDSRGHHSKPKPSSLSWRTTLSSNGVVPSPLTSSNLSFNGLPKRSVLPVVRCSGAAVNLGRVPRPRPAPADFLRDWGAIVVNLLFVADCCWGCLCDEKSEDPRSSELVANFGVANFTLLSKVIDCATGRPEEPIKTVDWEGKVALIQCAKAMGIQKYVFFSIHNCDNHPEVPLMEIKYCTEKFLQDIGLSHIIIRLCGFMQHKCLLPMCSGPNWAVCSTYTRREICVGNRCYTRIAYMDTQDIARLTFIALRNEKINGKLLTFSGPRAWTTQEVITLCERLAGQDANVTTVPVSVLKLTRQLTRLFEWTNDVADRLAFSEVLTSDTVSRLR